jgi:hypothetical protein
MFHFTSPQMMINNEKFGEIGGNEVFGVNMPQ